MLIDWSGIRTAAIAVGVREAARQAAADLTPEESNRFVERVMKRSSREKWLVRQQPVTPASQQVREVRNGSDILLNELERNGHETKLSLSRSAKRMAKDSEGATLRHAPFVHKVAQTAALVHGWDQKPEQASVMVNVAILGVDPQSVCVGSAGPGHGCVDV